MTRAGVPLLVLGIIGGWAAAGGPALVAVQRHGQASLWLDKRGDVKLSETLTIVMRVEGADPLEVDFTDKVRSTEGWHLEKVGAPKVATNKEGRARWEQTFRATPLQPGQHQLPLPGLEFTDKGGKEQKVAWTPLVVKIVTRVAKVDISEARDLTGIEELPPVPVTQTLWWRWALCGLLVPALIVFLRLRLRSRPLLPPSPHEVALRQLEELTRLPLRTTPEVQHYHARLSDVLRQYLEQRFELPATRQTTPEIFAAMGANSRVPAEPQALLNDILARCDLAKFARVVPSAEECQRVVSLARQFVERTAAGGTGS